MPSKSTEQIRQRRVRNCVALVVAMVVLAYVVSVLGRSLWHSAFLTGYLLLGSFVLLTLFGVRKRLSFIPNIGSASFWMQLHIYVGWATLVMFGMHVSWSIPNGIFETTLAILFFIVAGSGVYGLIITRAYPAKLTSLGGEEIFERIPLRRAQIASRARELILNSGESAEVLGPFYVNRLAAFFEKPRGWMYLAMPNGRLKRQLVSDISDLDRYLPKDQRKIGKALSQIVEERDRLDYHSALQGRLKGWLFVHIGFTYSLLLLSIVHGVLAHAFAGAIG
jgi:hypothetical protein